MRIAVNHLPFHATGVQPRLRIYSVSRSTAAIAELKALTPELIHEFVDRIVVYAPKTIDGKHVQLLDIYYSGVGILHELPPEEMEEAFQQHLIERNKEKTA